MCPIADHSYPVTLNFRAMFQDIVPHFFGKGDHPVCALINVVIDPAHEPIRKAPLSNIVRPISDLRVHIIGYENDFRPMPPGRMYRCRRQDRRIRITDHAAIILQNTEMKTGTDREGKVIDQSADLPCSPALYVRNPTNMNSVYDLLIRNFIAIKVFLRVSAQDAYFIPLFRQKSCRVIGQGRRRIFLRIKILTRNKNVFIFSPLSFSDHSVSAFQKREGIPS